MRATRGALRARLACCAPRLAPAAPPRALPAAALRCASRSARLRTRLRGSAADVAAPAADEEEAAELAADMLVSSAAASAAAAQHDCRLVIGVDPDVHGALGVMRWGPQAPPAGGNGVSAAPRAPADADAAALHSKVFDTPAMEVKFGTGAKARMRLRHDPLRIDALLRSLRAPPGTLAVLERPHARARDGSSAAFHSGCGLGLWWGLLTAQGFTVRLALPRAWKQHYRLVGKDVDKNDSRGVAIAMFPDRAAELARKLDHGRAEALLIAAYGVMDGDSAAGAAASAGGAGGVVPEFAAEMKRRHAAASAAVAGGSAGVLAAAAEELSAAKKAARAEAAARAKAAKAALPKQPRRRKADAAPAAPAAAATSSRTLAQLREALRALGLKVSGTKAELELRLAGSADTGKR